MFYDNRIVFMDSQVVQNEAAEDEYNEISDVIDLGATPTLRSLSFEGMSLRVVAEVVGFTEAATATIQVTLESSGNADLTTSSTVHWASGALLGVDVPTGVFAIVPLPTKANYERYLGVRVTYSNPAADGANMSATWSAHLAPVVGIHTAYQAASQ